MAMYRSVCDEPFPHMQCSGKFPAWGSSCEWDQGIDDRGNLLRQLARPGAGNDPGLWPDRRGGVAGRDAQRVLSHISEVFISIGSFLSVSLLTYWPLRSTLVGLWSVG